MAVVGQGKKYAWFQTPKGREYIKRHNRNAAQRQAAYRKRNRDMYLARHREEQRSWRKTPYGKRKIKDSSLRKKYGLSIEQFEQMAEDQNRQCAICKKTLDMGFDTHVDHCHKTLIVRGLLCSTCNTSLGCFRDSTSILRNAIAYLERHGG